jgi:hypothetical protein
MTILQGEAPPPSFRSIFAGIAAAILLLLAFLNLPVLVKYAGAVLAFIPSKIGLIQVVRPEEIMPVDMSISPTSVTLTKPGNYALYTDNYDLLVINDAVVEAHKDPWVKIELENKKEIQVDLVSRGMALYDTVYARGRPVATFTIETPGTYLITHPTRYAIASIVPNYMSGQENWTNFLFIVEVIILVVVIVDIRAALRARKQRMRK